MWHFLGSISLGVKCGLWKVLVAAVNGLSCSIPAEAAVGIGGRLRDKEHVQVVLAEAGPLRAEWARVAWIVKCSGLGQLWGRESCRHAEAQRRPFV
ncbi:hypothetical protein SKAU_G00000100 [Synaphobranchus kaupii]|uniref:Secreted protein n=1 Tax=Synaphobranchus kaupii TaxID=118154 RepID=A0A9Q1G9N3_SYNKA|nr:hypothetical protein SKAU_G00000100 [Synaphobranchus kaupii]